MKRILLVATVLFTFACSAYAQTPLEKIKTTAGAAGFDVSKLGGDIMGRLGSALSLTGDQTPKVSNLITDFLTKKSQIIPLQQTDNASYTSKASSLSSNLLGKLKTVLTAVQYAKLLGLKPKASDASNVLSQLFY